MWRFFPDLFPARVDSCPEPNRAHTLSTRSKRFYVERHAAPVRVHEGRAQPQTAAGCWVIDVRRVAHQSISASSRSGGAPIRPPAGPSVGLGPETVCVTALYRALGESRLGGARAGGAGGGEGGGEGGA